MHTCNIQHKLLLFVCSKDHATCDPKKESMRRDKLKLAPVFQCSWKPKAFPAFFVLSLLIFTWISISSNKRTRLASFFKLFCFLMFIKKQRNGKAEMNGKKFEGNEIAELYCNMKTLFLSRQLAFLSALIQSHN